MRRAADSDFECIECTRGISCRTIRPAACACNGKRKRARRALRCVRFRRSSGIHCFSVQKRKGGNRCVSPKGTKARGEICARANSALSIAVRAAGAFVNSHSIGNIDTTKVGPAKYCPSALFSLHFYIYILQNAFSSLARRDIRAYFARGKEYCFRGKYAAENFFCKLAIRSVYYKKF